MCVMIRTLIISVLLLASLSWARGNRTAAAKHPPVYRYPATKCTTRAGPSAGKIKRNPKAMSDFMKSHPCPSTGKTSGACKGYVVDHIVPLKRGGADVPGNMQWQTSAEAKAKDKIE